MSNFTQNTGVDASGETVALPVSGEVAPPFHGDVPANGTLTTGWFNTDRFAGLGFVFWSTGEGRYTIEYSQVQGELFTPMIEVVYNNGDVGSRRKGAIDQDARWARITWYNTSGQTAKTSMRVTQKTNNYQPSLETLSAVGAGTRLAMWAKAVLHIKDAGGVFADVLRTGNALNVHLDQPITLDTSALAKDSTLTNGTQTVKIVDDNNVAFGTVARPLNVTVSNPYTAPATQTVNGTVNIGNLPTTQPISGSVTVSNFPTNQTVGGTVAVSNFPQTQPVSGTVAISNLPTTQAVNGTVNVGNFPTTQLISGTVTVANPVNTVAVSNFPTTQPVSIAGVVQVASIPTATGGYPTIGTWQPATGAFFTNIVTGTRKLGVLVISNLMSSAIALALYDQVAVPTSSSTPNGVYVVQPNTTFAVPLADGLHFNNGIGMGVMAGSVSILNIVGGLLTLVTAGQIKVSYAIV